MVLNLQLLTRDFLNDFLKNCIDSAESNATKEFKTGDAATIIYFTVIHRSYCISVLRKSTRTCQQKTVMQPRFKPGTFQILLCFLRYFFLTLTVLLTRSQLFIEQNEQSSFLTKPASRTLVFPCQSVNFCHTVTQHHQNWSLQQPTLSQYTGFITGPASGWQYEYGGQLHTCLCKQVHNAISEGVPSLAH